MPRKRPSLAARWEGYRSRYRGIPGVALAGPLSPVTYPQTKLVTRVEIAPGADLTADTAAWSWVDITQWVRHDLGISTVVGRRDQAGTVDPQKATLKLDNRDGRFTRRNPLSPYYGQLTRNTPIRIGVDPGSGVAYRHFGFVNEWPKRWDRSGNDSTVTIQCGGLLRRLQRARSLRSPMFRTMAGVTAADVMPLAYWPGEDESQSTVVASGLVGGAPMTTSGDISFSSYSDLAGSQPILTLGADSALFGTVPSYTDVGKWFFNLSISVPSEPASSTVLMTVNVTGGSIAQWRLTLVPGSPSQLEWQAYNSAGVALVDVNEILALDGSGGGKPTEADFYGRPFMLVLGSVQRTGSIVGASAGITDGSVNPTVGGFQNTGTHSTLKSFRITSAAGTAGFSVGHIGIFTDAAFAEASGSRQNASALLGHAGEMAHERMVRVCREEGIPFHCVAAESAPVGPQQTGSIVEVLRDAERADMGVLYEHEFGLGYRALSEYYNDPVQLPLDFDAGHVGDPPEADDSDLKFRNQWTVTRSGGSSYTYRDPNYSDVEGLSEGSATVNVETDEQVPVVAGWMVHRDTVDEDYWTGLKLRFSRAPDIIPTWTSLPFGARLTVANPPSQADPGDVDAVIEGWTERWDQVQWEATLNTSPASVYRILELDSAVLGWLDSDTSTLTADISDSATSISVTTTAAELWTTSADEYPTDIIVGGEVMTVTAVTGGSSPQTFTVVRSVNGITKSHLAGAEVHAHPATVLGV